MEPIVITLQKQLLPRVRSIMQLSINIDSRSKQSLQIQIFESIRKQILSGQLKANTVLPSSRLLSEQLNVSRNTIVLTYDRLIAEDYICSRKTIGTFVNPELPESSLTIRNDKDKVLQEVIHSKRNPVNFNGRVHSLENPNKSKLDIDFWVGRPDPDSFPLKSWKKLMLHHLQSPNFNMTDYHESSGIPDLRQAIVDHLLPARGIKASQKQVIITNGSQQGLNIVARMLINKGAKVVTECPCYQGAVFVFESYGAVIHSVDVDDNGLKVSELPDLPIKMAYVTPSHQYPMGSTLSSDRRISLLDWARKVGAYIIEDDYDSDFRHHGSPLTALAGQDQYNSVIYLGTFSKSIGAGLRIGYLIVPPELIETTKTIKKLMDNGHAWLDQAVLADFISSGAYSKHLRKIRRVYINRRDALIEALNKYFGDVNLSGLEGGMHIVWKLSEHMPDASQMKKIAEKVGVGIYILGSGAAHEFEKKENNKRTLLLGYSSVPEDRIQEGIKRIAAVL